jgi:hypothetical protein
VRRSRDFFALSAALIEAKITLLPFAGVFQEAVCSLEERALCEVDVGAV